MSRTSKILIAILAVLGLFTFAPMAFGQDPGRPATVATATTEQSVVKVVRLEHAHAGQLESVLRQLAGRNRKGSELTVASDARTNSILVRGGRHETARVEGMIAALDRKIPQPQRPAKPEVTIEVIHLEFRTAANVQPIISELFYQSMPRALRGGPRPAPSALRVIADGELNALIVKADGPTMDQIKKLLTKLDVEVPVKKKTEKK